VIDAKFLCGQIVVPNTNYENLSVMFLSNPQTDFIERNDVDCLTSAHESTVSITILACMV